MREPENVRFYNDLIVDVEDKDKVNLQVEYYKYKIAHFAQVYGFNPIEKAEMVRHLHQIENSLETILRYSD